MKSTHGIRWSFIGIIMALGLTAGTVLGQTIGSKDDHTGQSLVVGSVPDGGTGENRTFSTPYAVGWTGGNNSLTIMDGYMATFTGNEWEGVYIGRGSNNNHIIVEEGGTLTYANQNTTHSAIRLGGYGTNVGHNNTFSVNGTASGLTNIRVGDGSNSTFNVVRVNNGSLTTSGYFQLSARNDATQSGFEVLGANSSVTVGTYLNTGQETGTSQDWVAVDAGTLTVGTYLYVGRSGSNGSVDITNNGTVNVGTHMNLGSNSSDSNHNTVTVEGTNSTLTVKDWVFVGRQGSNNTLTVKDGGHFEITDRYLALGFASGADNNKAIITNATMTVEEYVNVGHVGSNAEFTVEEGGTVNAGDMLRVGRNGSNNEATVRSGGQVTAGSVYLSDLSTSVNNTLTVTGTDSRLTAYGDNIGGEIIIGNVGANNTMEVSAGAEVEAGRFFIVGSGSSDNTLRVNNANVTIGTDPGEDLTLRSLRIGAGSAAHRNAVELTGAEALLTMSGFAWVGGYGSDNTLDIRNGANMTLTGSVIIGRYDGSEDNTVTVDGADGTTRSYLNPGVVEVGGSGGNNTMIVSGGALVETGTTYIGRNETSGGNLLHVTGADSEFINSGTIFLSPEGTIGNVIRVDQDGYLQGSTLEVGANGTVEVQAGGIATTTGDMRISSGLGPDYDPGAADPEETRLAGLDISGATSSATSTGIFRLGNASSDNLVTVRDGGELNVAGILYVSDESADSHGNRLVVENATVNQTNPADFGRLQIGSNVTSPGNSSMLVTGPDAELNVAGFLWLGPNTQNNSLEIRDGASAGFGGVAWIGRYGDSGNNTLTVDGVNGSTRSTFSTTSSFGVGHDGSDNTTVVSGGALASVGIAYIGRGGSASNNLLHVTGTGSEFISSATLHVGNSTQAGNVLKVDEDGRAESVNLNVYANGAVEIDAGIVSTWNMAVDEDAQVTLSNNSLLHVGTGWASVNTHGESYNLLQVVGSGVLTANGEIDLGTGGILLVEEGGTVQGAGTITGDADVFGVLRPGNSAGTLDFNGGLTLHGDSSVYIELGDEENDVIKANSILVNGGTLYFSLIEGYDPVPFTYTIFDTENDVLSGAFDDYNTDALPDGWTVNTDNLYTLGQITIIPEPHTMGLILLGLGAVALRRRLRSSER